MGSFRAVILDLNGVFLQSEYLSKRIEEKYGISGDDFLASLKEVMAVARKPGVEDSFVIWRPHLKKLGLAISKDEFFDFWFSGEKLVSEIFDYIKELRVKGVKVFILSNNFKERTEYYRKNFSEIFQNVDGVYFSWETGFVKPDQEAYKNLLTQNSLLPEECVYFDDSPENIEVARGLGIDAQKYQGFQKAKEYLEKILGRKYNTFER